MANNNQNRPRTQNVLEALFMSAMNKLENVGKQLNVLKVQLDLNIGEVQLYDDRETLLEKNIIFDWTNLPVKDLHQCKQQTNSIRVALIDLKRRNFFENPVIIKPFSVIFADDNFVEIEKIFTLADNEYVSEGRLMKNMEQDLQNFYKKLFADAK
ncbi:MAG: hypothetical protein LBD80_01195 [Tannerella sp.]|jgi:hypothetical protein|nr:hypothetical protein [Tannerella sp.]